MNPRILTVNKLSAAVAAAALLGGASNAAAVPVSLQLDYSCPLPLIGTQTIPTDIRSDIPAETPVGPTDLIINIEADAFINENARAGLKFGSAATLEGKAIAESSINTQTINLPLIVELDIPPTTIPDQPTDSGFFVTPASGSVPQPAFNEQQIGEATVTVGALTLDMISRKADGSLAGAPVGEFVADCEQIAGQDNLLHTFNVLPGDPVEPDPEPNISVTPESIAFGNVIQGTSSDPQSVTISNTGDAALGITSIALSGDGSFLETNNNCGSSVAANSSCSVDITFAPGSLGEKSAQLVIESTDPDTATSSVDLTGNGTEGPQPGFEVAPVSVDFGIYNLKDQTGAVSETVTISNPGDAALQIDSIATDGDIVFSADHSCTTIAAGSDCAVTVSYLPTDPGQFSGNLVVTPADGYDLAPVTVGLSAQATAGDVVEPPIFLLLDLEGATNIAASNSMLPLSGSIAAELTMATGEYVADLQLAPTSGRFDVIQGWSLLKATAQVEFEPISETTGTLEAGTLTANSVMYINIPKITTKIFGFDIKVGGGDDCRTVEPVEINLTSVEGENFSPATGGTVTGSYDLPELENCGLLTKVFTKKIAGPGNYIELDLTPVPQN